MSLILAGYDFLFFFSSAQARLLVALLHQGFQGFEPLEQFSVLLLQRGDVRLLSLGARRNGLQRYQQHTVGIQRSDVLGVRS